jgi:ABC-type bacteriocin/lantibiotic exporter with double-glycine peptidase domain
MLGGSAANGVALRLLLVSCLALGMSGCVGYTGAARDVSADILMQERGWVAVRGMTLIRQRAGHDCGPTALAIVVRHYLPALSAAETTRGFDPERRASAAELRERARELGLSAFVLEATVEDLAHELERQRPVIVGVAKSTATGPVSHYEVVIGIHPRTRRVLTLDPAVGWRQNSLLEFMKEWVSTGNVAIFVLPVAAPTASR